ncbi:MAG: hypothetical protein ACRDLT_08140 [Solirubrobacteraceae bacterium]
MRLKGVVYDVGRAMGSWSPNWRPDYTSALMRRELEIIQTDLHANAVRLASRGCWFAAIRWRFRGLSMLDLTAFTSS